MRNFDLILWNNSTKACYLYPKNRDMGSAGYYIFENLDFSSLPSGEYTYAIVHNDRNDVVYEESEIPLNTLIKTSEGNVRLRDLAIETGLLKIKGDNKEKTSYRNREVSFKYYAKK